VGVERGDGVESGKLWNQPTQSGNEDDMDGRGPSGAAGRVDDEDEFLSLLREVFQWPEPPETLRADIIRRLAEVSHQLEVQSLRMGIPSPDASIGGMERSQESISAPHLPP
jgi:hypothetical protein